MVTPVCLSDYNMDNDKIFPIYKLNEIVKKGYDKSVSFLCLLSIFSLFPWNLLQTQTRQAYNLFQDLRNKFLFFPRIKKGMSPWFLSFLTLSGNAWEFLKHFWKFVRSLWGNHRLWLRLVERSLVLKRKANIYLLTYSYFFGHVQRSMFVGVSFRSCTNIKVHRCINFLVILIRSSELASCFCQQK